MESSGKVSGRERGRQDDASFRRLQQPYGSVCEESLLEAGAHHGSWPMGRNVATHRSRVSRLDGFDGRFNLVQESICARKCLVMVESNLA